MHGTGGSPSLSAVIRACAASHSAKQLSDELVRIAREGLAPTRPSIWLRDRLTGTYHPFDTEAAERFGRFELPLRLTERQTAEQLLSELPPMVQRGRQQEPSHRFGEHGLVQLAMRGGSCVGLLLAENALTPPSDAQALLLRALADAIVVAYDRDSVAKLLQAQRLDLTARDGYGEFLDSLAAHVATAARMQYVAIRELDRATSTLVTLAVHGFPDGDPRRYDLKPVEEFPDFVEALNGATVVVPNMNGAGRRALRKIEELRDVKSFLAAPLEVRGAPPAVVSGASKHEYEYSETEILGFTNLARHVGVYLGYFRSAQTQREQLMELTETAAAFTGIEVAAAVRHEAKLKVANVTSRIDNVVSAFKQGRMSVGYERLEKLKRDTNLLYDALDQLRLATIPPNRSSEAVGLRDLIEEAISAASSNLQQARISRPTPSGPNPQVLVYRDWFRQVIVNLLLNSIDAFAARRGSQGSREIAMRIEPVTAKASTVRFHYSDNAGGLQPHRLTRADGNPIVNAEAAIFEKGVTSKKTGTGYGLWLVRSIMTEHGGSIVLVDHRGGMSFALQLPVASESPLPSPRAPR